MEVEEVVVEGEEVVEVEEVVEGEELVEGEFQVAHLAFPHLLQVPSLQTHTPSSDTPSPYYITSSCIGFSS